MYDDDKPKQEQQCHSCLASSSYLNEDMMCESCIEQARQQQDDDDWYDDD